MHVKRNQSNKALSGLWNFFGIGTLAFELDLNTVLTAHRSPLTAHRSPLTAHRSPLTAHGSPKNAHHPNAPPRRPPSRTQGLRRRARVLPRKLESPDLRRSGPRYGFRAGQPFAFGEGRV